jgi:hypothetical protein
LHKRVESRCPRDTGRDVRFRDHRGTRLFTARKRRKLGCCYAWHNSNIPKSPRVTDDSQTTSPRLFSFRQGRAQANSWWMSDRTASMNRATPRSHPSYAKFEEDRLTAASEDSRTRLYYRQHFDVEDDQLQQMLLDDNDSTLRRRFPIPA